MDETGTILFIAMMIIMALISILCARNKDTGEKLFFNKKNFFKKK